jgi:hypothetical protein
VSRHRGPVVRAPYSYGSFGGCPNHNGQPPGLRGCPLLYSQSTRSKLLYTRHKRRRLQRLRLLGCGIAGR